MSDTGGTTPALREPAHRVSPRAVPYWRTSALLGGAVVVLIVAAAWAVLPAWPWWAALLAVVLLVAEGAYVVLMPRIRYAVHRWEVTDLAVHTLSGWIGRETRIAPLSRVQTVDSRQGPLMRHFGLASLTVTTASAAGPITIDCLDEATAKQLVAQLTAITSASEGDAT